MIATVPVVASLHASTFAALHSQMCLPASTFELPSYILRNYLSSGAATLQIYTQTHTHKYKYISTAKATNTNMYTFTTPILLNPCWENHRFQSDCIYFNNVCKDLIHRSEYSVISDYFFVTIVSPLMYPS